MCLLTSVQVSLRLHSSSQTRVFAAGLQGLAWTWASQIISIHPISASPDILASQEAGLGGQAGTAVSASTHEQ